MLSITNKLIMLSVIMIYSVMLSVIMLNVVMLSVVAPCEYVHSHEVKVREERMKDSLKDCINKNSYNHITISLLVNVSFITRLS